MAKATPSYKKRFWKSADVRPVQGGFGVFLDDRQLRTPAKAALVVPTSDLAEEVAKEWLAQEGNVRPEIMPATRMSNSAIDLVAVQFDAVTDMIAEFGTSDLLCYRAEAPAELVALQADAWNPLLDWAASRLNAPLSVTTGVLPVAQPVQSVSRLRAAVAENDPFRLAALHDLVTLSGSLVIGLAAAANHLGSEEAWTASRIDETWQERQWGVDEEAAATAARKKSQFKFAVAFLELLNGQQGRRNTQ